MLYNRAMRLERRSQMTCLDMDLSEQVKGQKLCSIQEAIDLSS